MNTDPPEDKQWCHDLPVGDGLKKDDDVELGGLLNESMSPPFFSPPTR